MTSSRACSMKLRWTVNSLLSILNFVGFFSTIRAHVIKDNIEKFNFYFNSTKFKYKVDLNLKVDLISTFEFIAKFLIQIETHLNVNFKSNINSSTYLCSRESNSNSSIVKLKCFRLEKDIDSVLKIIEVPLDGTKRFP